MNMAEFWDVLDKDGNKTGKQCERGHLQDDEYHLVLQVWILNSQGEFLISRRTPNKPWPLFWECTGGSAIAGDDSITSAIKEVAEELGVILDPANGKLFHRFTKLTCCNTCGNGHSIIDAWLFRQDIDIAAVTLQPEETCDAMWASKEKIRQMLEDEQFIGYEFYPYLDELFDEV